MECKSTDSLVKFQRYMTKSQFQATLNSNLAQWQDSARRSTPVLMGWFRSRNFPAIESHYC